MRNWNKYAEAQFEGHWEEDITTDTNALNICSLWNKITKQLNRCLFTLPYE